MSEIYGIKKPQEIPTYNLTEAAKYLRIATATLRSWIIGRPYPSSTGSKYFKPLILLPKGASQLSFENLIEAHVLRALRIEHKVSIKDVRVALDFSQNKLNIDRLLISPELRTTAGALFLEKYGELIELNRSGQLAMKKILDRYLSRVVWEKNIPTRLYPFLDDQHDRIISIDPLVSFGKPVIEKKGISTSVIVNRINAGESINELASDYDLSQSEIETALVYEQAA